MTVQHTDERRPLAFTVTRRKKWRFKGKRTLAALLLLVLFLAPFLWMVIMSLRPSMDAFDLTHQPAAELAYRQPGHRAVGDSGGRRLAVVSVHHVDGAGGPANGAQ